MRAIRFQFLFTHPPNKRPWLFSHHTSQTYINHSLFHYLEYSVLSLSLSAPHTFVNAMAIVCMKTQQHKEDDQQSLVFDASVLRYESDIPKQFIWPDDEKPCPNTPELPVPLIDLGDFLSGNPEAAMKASKLVGEACEKHGFFLVVNHGVEEGLISDAHRYMEDFFGLPLFQKQRAQRKVGEHCGYASSFTGRFSSKLPWKETLSFRYTADQSSSNVVKDYLCNAMGEDFEEFGYVNVKQSNVMLLSSNWSSLSFRFLSELINLMFACVVQEGVPRL